MFGGVPPATDIARAAQSLDRWRWPPAGCRHAPISRLVLSYIREWFTGLRRALLVWQAVNADAKSPKAQNLFLEFEGAYQTKKKNTVSHQNFN